MEQTHRPRPKQHPEAMQSSRDMHGPVTDPDMVDHQETEGNLSVQQRVARSGDVETGASPPLDPWTTDLFAGSSSALSGMEWTPESASELYVEGDIDSRKSTDKAPEQVLTERGGLGGFTYQHSSSMHGYDGTELGLGSEHVYTRKRKASDEDTAFSQKQQVSSEVEGGLSHLEEGFSGGISGSVEGSSSVKASGQVGDASVVQKEDRTGSVSGSWSEGPGSTRKRLAVKAGGSNARAVRTDEDDVAVTRSVTDSGSAKAEVRKGKHAAGGKVSGDVDRTWSTGRKWEDDGVVHKTEDSHGVGVHGDISRSSKGNWSGEFGGDLYGGLERTEIEFLSDGRRVEETHFARGGVGGDIEVDYSDPDLILSADGTVGHKERESWVDGSVSHAHDSTIRVDSGVSHNIDEGDTSAKGKVTLRSGREETRDLGGGAQEISGVDHETRIGGSMDWSENLLERENWTGDVYYGMTLSKGQSELVDEGVRTDTRSHKIETINKFTDESTTMSLGYQNINSDKLVREDGSSTEESVIYKAKATGARKDMVDDEGAKNGDAYSLGLDLGRTQRTKETVMTEDGKVTRQDDNSLNVNAGYGTDDKKFRGGFGKVAYTQNIREDGSRSRTKVTDSISGDHTGAFEGGRKIEMVDSYHKKKLDDETHLITNRGKSTVEFGAGTSKDEDGDRTYDLRAGAGYTAFSQDVIHRKTPTFDKVEGLKLGDRDTDGNDEVRTLQKALNKAGFEVTENGEYDNATLKAVQQFQSSKGLAATENGLVDEDTAFALPAIGLFGKGGGYRAGYDVGTVSGKVSAKTKFTADQIKVKGQAGAKISMVGANAKIDLPVFVWRMGGERIATALTFGVSAEVLAEANGTVDIGVDRGADKLSADVGGKASAFVGAKGGVEVGAELQWMRYGPQQYGQLLYDFATSLPGGADDWLMDKLPTEFWPQLAAVLVGTRKSTVAYARAGLEGSAGLGASAEFNAGIKNGMIEVSGAMSGTVGLGGGAKTSVGLHAVDGVRLGGVMGMRGITWLSDQVQDAAKWMDQVVDEIQEYIDAELEEEKKEGGISGFFAKATDFVGDDLLNLW